MSVPGVVELELCCPAAPVGRNLLAKLRVHPGAALIDGFGIELPCGDCGRARRARGLPPARVLHRYALTGELIETVTHCRSRGTDRAPSAQSA